MAVKLKSISRQIHWSLLLRAAIFALAWFFFPFWLFCLIALYLYFTPFFQTRKLFLPFLALLILTFIQGPSLPYLVIFAALFYYLLLIKNLLLIDRNSAREILVLALTFFLVHDFYRDLGGAIGFAAVAWAFLAAILIGVLAHNFMNATADVGSPQVRRVAGWLVFLITWQFLLIGLFLPLAALYQAIVGFLAVTLAIDLIAESTRGSISRTKLLVVGTTTFAFFVILFSSIPWNL
jgi:hypothetical protein